MVSDSLRFSGFATYMHAALKDYFDNATGFDRSRERPVDVPKFSFGTSATYQKDTSFGNIQLRADYRWTSDIAKTQFNYFLDAQGVAHNATNNAVMNPVVAQQLKDTTTEKAGGVLNARLSATFGDNHYTAAVFVQNITNRRTIQSAAVIPAPFDQSTGSLREPRSWGINLKYEW